MAAGSEAEAELFSIFREFEFIIVFLHPIIEFELGGHDHEAN